MGWCVWRSAEYLPKELIFNINYLGADQASFTLNFSKGASQVIGQYYQLIRLGKHGYKLIMTNLTRTADYLAASLTHLGFIILSQGGGKGLPLVAFRLDNSKGDLHFDEFDVAHHLRRRGWVVPAYTMAPHSESLKLMRVVVREDFSRARCDSLVIDFKHTLDVLRKIPAEEVETATKYAPSHSLFDNFIVFCSFGGAIEHTTHAPRGGKRLTVDYRHSKPHSRASRKKNKHPHLDEGEKHSLQGKHGKVINVLFSFCFSFSLFFCISITRFHFKATNKLFLAPPKSPSNKTTST